MLHLVSIAELVLWFISAVVMAESCRNRAWFYACAVGSFAASFFGGFGQIIGTMIPVGGIFTAALMAAAAVVFAFLGFRLLFPKAGLPAPAEEGSRSPAIDRSRVFKEHGLSPREQEVASLMVMGLDNDSIGEKLCISNPAVRYHIGNIYGKFNIDGKKGGRAAFLAKVLKTQAAESPLFPPGGKLH
jgi:DNA-binding CsgD family transcriptional regulator